MQANQTVNIETGNRQESQKTEEIMKKLESLECVVNLEITELWCELGKNRWV